MSISTGGPHEPMIRCRRARRQEYHNTFRFQFLDEGAANVVFRVIPCSGESKGYVFHHREGTGKEGTILQRHELEHRVLRMSKGKPKTLRYREIMHGFEHEVLPLFRKIESRYAPNSDESRPDVNSISIHTHPRNLLNLSVDRSFEEFVMDHQGVSLSYEALHALAYQLHKNCPHNKHIKPRELEQEGILLPDMSAEPNGTSFTIEIKPKWLLQSPDAPRDAYLCRTCALHASRKAEKEYDGPWICPLALAAGSVPAIEQWLHAVIETTLPDERKKGTSIDTLVARALSYLTEGPGHTLLQHLRYLQSHTDQRGILFSRSENGSSPTYTLPPAIAWGIRLAMTLRDCSLFVRIPYDESVPIEAKLGDLDFKSSHKFADWFKKEEMLVNGGWYTTINGGVDGGPSGCWIASGWKKFAPWYF